ncbi:hypothetical protein F4808DRAFT_455345 [Astrocystis sublimbata]|nr:hypothetical protein F4808DRAFT_455345 [Astrocystis sublimbata]
MTSRHIVSSQADADDDKLENGVIDIQEAAGTLNFTKLTAASSITVHESPELELMSFPQLLRLDGLEISDAEALTTVSCPKLLANSGAASNATPFLDVNITNAPKLVSLEMDINLWGNIVLLGAVGSLDTSNITSALSLHIDSCLGFPGLEWAGSLHVAGYPSCNYDLVKLNSVGNFTTASRGDTHSTNNYYRSLSSFSPIQINSTMTVESTTILDNTLTNDTPATTFGRFGTVGDDLNVMANSHVDLEFGGLTKVGSNLSVSNNTNCTFAFAQLSSVGNLFMLDNVDTVLPRFPLLERVGNVHLRGYIDTSGGPNIFPALTLASGSVVVEPWNPDFDCSKLVSQQKDDLIHTLTCNGTNNGTDVPSPSTIPSTSADSHKPTQLSTGQSAGIGVSIGVAFFAFSTWICLRIRSRVMALEKAQKLAAIRSVKMPMEDVRSNVSGLHEADHMGTTETPREKPDDHLPIWRVKAELPDNQVIELPVGEAELPVSPQR